MRGGGDVNVRGGGDDDVNFALEPAPVGDGVRCTDFADCADLVSTFVGV